MWTWKDRPQIDEQEWDGFLHSADKPYLEFSSWYLDICCSHWGAFFQEEGKLRLPVPYSRKAGLVHCVTRPPYLQKLKLIGRSIPEDRDVLGLFDALQKRFPCGTLDWEYHLEDSRVRANYILEEGTCKLNQSQARHLRKSRQAGLTYRISDDAQELFRWLDTNGERYAYEKDFRNPLFKDLVGSLLRRRKGFVIFAEDPSGQIQSAGIFTREYGRFLFFLSFNTASGRTNGSMVGIIDHVVHRIMKPGDMLDLEGSDIPGVAAFYEGFGARKAPYFEQHWSNHPLCRLADLVRKIGRS